MDGFDHYAFSTDALGDPLVKLERRHVTRSGAVIPGAGGARAWRRIVPRDPNAGWLDGDGLDDVVAPPAPEPEPETPEPLLIQTSDRSDDVAVLEVADEADDVAVLEVADEADDDFVLEADDDSPDDESAGDASPDDANEVSPAHT